jgi:peptidoglycan/xylan/chitin deacetylase (PgdA/CDA1 family)
MPTRRAPLGPVRLRRRSVAALALALTGTAVMAPAPAGAAQHIAPKAGVFTGTAQTRGGAPLGQTELMVRHGALDQVRVLGRSSLLDRAASSPGCALGSVIGTAIDTVGHTGSGKVHGDGSFVRTFVAPVGTPDGTTGTDTIVVDGRFNARTHARAVVRQVVDTVSADGARMHCVSLSVLATATHPSGVMWPFPAGPRDIDCTRVKCVALTFDDGPGSQTPALLEMLARAHARATFFVLGEMVQKRPGALRQIVRAGHEVGDHSWSHPQLPKLSDAAVHSQVTRTAAEIRRASGVRPALMRPPYGDLSNRVRADLRKDGWPIVLWSVDPLDWRDRNASLVTHRVLSQVHPGSIVLMHDIHPTTVAAVPAILRELSRRGYTFVSVSELYGSTRLRPGSVYNGRTRDYARKD